MDRSLCPIYETVLPKIVFILRYGDSFIFFEKLSSLRTGMRKMCKTISVTATFHTWFTSLLLQFKSRTTQLNRLLLQRLSVYYNTKSASSETCSVSITCDTSNCVQSQASNQKASLQPLVQPQQSTTQKSHLANASSTTIPVDQHITMNSRRLQSTSPSLQQPKEMEKAKASQKFYSIAYNSRTPSSQCQVVREKDFVTRDNREAIFHYAPSHNRLKQFSPRFQRMAQEQPANQQQQQQQSQHLQSNRHNTIAYSTSIPAM